MDANFNLVLIQARKLYKKQIVKNDQTKYLCLQRYRSMYKGDFFKAYRHEVLEMTDSIRFCEKCKILGVKPSYVAQNMIFDGVKGIENIDKYVDCKLIFD